MNFLLVIFTPLSCCYRKHSFRAQLSSLSWNAPSLVRTRQGDSAEPVNLGSSSDVWTLGGGGHVRKEFTFARAEKKTQKKQQGDDINKSLWESDIPKSI